VTFVISVVKTELRFRVNFRVFSYELNLAETCIAKCGLVRAGLCAQSPWAEAGDGTGRGEEMVTCVTLAPALRSASIFTSVLSSPFR
jgi:hypothetical protein